MVQRSSSSGREQQNGRLESWKEIASHLRRDVKTVQRWERDLGLPVHRLFINSQARVYAYPGELDAWAASRSGEGTAASLANSDDTSRVAGDSPRPAESRRSAYVFWFALAAGMLATIIYLSVTYEGAPFHARNAADLKTTPFTSSTGAEDYPAISPDGRQMAFSATNPSGGNDIYVQLVGSVTPLQLTRSPSNDRSPAWSPDGTEIVFLRRFGKGNKVIRIPALGGPETILTESAFVGEGVSWSPNDDLIAMADRLDSGGVAIFLFSVDDLAKRPFSHPTGSAIDWFPKFDPTGQRLAYLRNEANRTEIHVASVRGGEPRVIQADARGFAWAADGGSLVFSAPSAPGGGELHRVHLADGRIERLGIGGSNTMWPNIVAGRLAYTRWILTTSIWSISLKPDGFSSSQPAARIISSSRRQHAPDFSPDGQWIVFASDRTGSLEIWVSDGAGGQLRMLTSFGGASAGSPRWSPDGNWIAFDSNVGGSVDIYLVPSSGGSPHRLTESQSDDIIPCWSHDGQWIYFVSDRSGERQLWKIPVGGGEAIQITQNGGFEARASADGSYLYYADDQNEELRRFRLSDGEEETIPELSGIGRLRRGWTVTDDGVYFIRREPETEAASHVEFFRFADRTISAVAVLEGSVLEGSAALAVSPDGRSLLYVIREQDERDIMLVENFH